MTKSIAASKSGVTDGWNFRQKSLNAIEIVCGLESSVVLDEVSAFFDYHTRINNEK